MKSELQKTILYLWHISRTALCTTDNGRGARFQYVMRELKNRATYAHLISGMTTKQIMYAVEDLIN